MTRLQLGGGIVALAIVTIWAFMPSVPQDSPVDPSDVYNPVLAGEPLPGGFRQLLPRDGIMPVYDPQFVTPAETDWPADTLVIGVAGGDEAKAYPVSFLTGREMVIDSIAGIPILVTW